MHGGEGGLLNFGPSGVGGGLFKILWQTKTKLCTLYLWSLKCCTTLITAMNYCVLVKLHWWLSKMAHDDWSRTSFSHAIITMITVRWLYTSFSFRNGGQICWWILETQIFVFVLFSRIIINAILLKQLVTSGSVNIAIVTSPSVTNC